jgi:hypothetical protein
MLGSSEPVQSVEADANFSSQSLGLFDAQVDPLRTTKKPFAFPTSPSLPLVLLDARVSFAISVS